MDHLVWMLTLYLGHQLLPAVLLTLSPFVSSIFVFLSLCIYVSWFPLPRKSLLPFSSSIKKSFSYQMDHITLCLDNRGLPSLFCFPFFPHRTLSPSFRLTRFFSLQLTEEVAGLIKSLLRERRREGKRRRGEGNEREGGGCCQINPTSQFEAWDLLHNK